MDITSEHTRHAGRILPVELIRLAIRWLNALAPIGDLLIRLWVANVFWKSGLTKIQSIDTTLTLFRYEYSVHRTDVFRPSSPGVGRTLERRGTVLREHRRGYFLSRAGRSRTDPASALGSAAARPAAARPGQTLD